MTRVSLPFGSWLDAAMERRKLRNADLVRALASLGRTTVPSGVSYWRSGTVLPGVETARDILAALGVTLEEQAAAEVAYGQCLGTTRVALPARDLPRAAGE